MGASEQIQQKIKALPAGKPFLSSRFLTIGSRAAVDQALHRMVVSGKIVRIARGMFAKPKISALVGQVRPGPQAIVEAIAKSTGETIGITGAEAELLMGLTTQMTTRPIYGTSGRSRVIKSGNAEIILRHTCTRKLKLASSPAGIVLLALWSRGSELVTEAVVVEVFNRLEPQDRKAVPGLFSLVPGWLARCALAVLAESLGLRFDLVENTLRLPADNREQKTKKQLDFLRDHPDEAAQGFFQHMKIRKVFVPNID